MNSSTKINGAKKKKIMGVLLVTCLFILTSFYLFPVYIMIVNALKTEHEFSMNQIALPSSLYLKNFIRAFYEMKYLRRLLNNLIVCSGYLTILITFSSMAAYVISKKLTKFNKKLYLYFLIGVIIPGAITLYPIYVQLKALGLINYGGLIIVYAAQAMPWAVFMYVGFMA